MTADTTLGAAAGEKPTRSYPLEIRDCSGEDANCLMSKGHHDLAAFKVAAEEYFCESIDHWEPARHVWLRTVPVQPGCGYRCHYVEAKPHSRGAFPATIVEAF